MAVQTAVGGHAALAGLRAGASQAWLHTGADPWSTTAGDRLVVGDAGALRVLAFGLESWRDRALRTAERLDHVAHRSRPDWSGAAAEAVRSRIGAIASQLRGNAEVTGALARAILDAAGTCLIPAQLAASRAAVELWSIRALHVRDWQWGLVLQAWWRARQQVAQARASWHRAAAELARAFETARWLLPDRGERGLVDRLGDLVAGWRGQLVDTLTLAKLTDPVRAASNPEAYVADLGAVGQSIGRLLSSGSLVSTLLDLPTLEHDGFRWFGAQLPIGLGVFGHLAHDLRTGTALVYRELDGTPSLTDTTDEIHQVLVQDASGAETLWWLKPAAGEDHKEWRGVAAQSGVLRSYATAYLDRILGFGVVPETLLIQSEQHGLASLQAHAPLPGRDPGAYAVTDGQQLAILDYLTAAGDRHELNWLTSSSGRPAAIDNGIAFTTPERGMIRSAFVESYFRTRLDQGLLDQVGAVDRRLLVSNLDQLGFDPLEVAYTLRRFDELVTRHAITGENWGGTMLRGNALHLWGPRADGTREWWE